MLPGIVTQNNIEDDATSLSWLALACFLTDVILLSTNTASTRGQSPKNFFYVD